MIGVFNRSHYEDVLVVRVKELVPTARWRAALRAHPGLRADARRRGHDGRQAVPARLRRRSSGKRLQDRIDSPDERWKFRPGDLDDRPLWPTYMAGVPRRAGARRRPPDAPWYVVPADRKWVRNLAVAQILRHTLERLDPQYPPPAEDLTGLVVTDPRVRASECRTGDVRDLDRTPVALDVLYSSPPWAC